MKEEIVKVKCLKHKYPDKTEVSACGLDFVVRRGEKIVLIGDNGSGKTTLLLHLSGILSPAEGEVKVFGVFPAKEFAKIGKRVGIVFQNVEDQLIGPTVFDDIAFSLANYGFKTDEIEKKVGEIMRKLKIEHLKDKIIHYLSGGEKKKVAIAGALVLEPELLILDEALAEVDEKSAKLIIEILNEISQKNKAAILMATNDLNIGRKFADIIYFLEEGRVSFRGNYDELVVSKMQKHLCKH